MMRRVRVRAFAPSQIIVEIEIEIEIGIGIDPCPGWHLASWTAQTSLPIGGTTATAVPVFSCPNPITRPFDTETDSDPDPDLASP
jgi:hypothetical protein